MINIAVLCLVPLLVLGPDLRKQSFSHGQLYVSCSGVENANILALYGRIPNKLYPEALSQWRPCPGRCYAVPRKTESIEQKSPSKSCLSMSPLCTGYSVKSESCIRREYGEGNVVCVCNATYCDTIPTPPQLSSGQYLVYHSSKDGHRFHSFTGNFSLSSNQADAHFTMNHTTTFQEIFGFGGAMTDATGINIASLSNQTQKKLLNSYFSPEGLQYNLLRVPMGGVDFSTHAYTYDDVENDVSLKHFQLAIEDYVYKIPYIKEAIALNPRNISLFTAPWSAPKWMKTNNDFIGAGQLKKEYYQLWADYFIRFLDEYAKNGLQFWSVSAQNEPLNGYIPSFKFNCMGWNAESEGEWIANYLGPTLKKNGYGQIKLITLDDQRPQLNTWPKLIFSNETVKQYISGIGVHWYMDTFTSPISLQKVHDSYPDMFVLYTEACNGVKEYGQESVVLGSWERGEAYAKNIIQTLNNWVVGWVDWNLALDENGGPNWANNFVDAPVIVNATADEFYKQPMFYVMGHFSKFITEGSRRIQLDTSDDKGIENVGFKTPEGNTVIVFLNRKDEAVKTAVADPKKGTITIELSGRSIITVVY